LSCIPIYSRFSPLQEWHEPGPCRPAAVDQVDPVTHRRVAAHGDDLEAAGFQDADIGPPARSAGAADTASEVSKSFFNCVTRLSSNS